MVRFFATWMAPDNKDHLGRNDRKDNHYNLIQSNWLTDLDLMPIRVFNSLTAMGSHDPPLFSTSFFGDW
jgi:hypothetical protein